MRRRAVLDVAMLDDHAFGIREPIWWGNLLMIFIEGAAFALMIVTYYYIRRNFNTWPPERTYLPDMGVSTANLILQLASLAPAWYASKRALAHEPPEEVGRWLMLVVACGVAAIVLRAFELRGLHTRYDSNAYGSITWMILITHLGHLIAGSLEALLIALVMFKGPVEKKHYTDATVLAAYWYFVVASWVVLWLVVFVSVRFI